MWPFKKAKSDTSAMSGLHTLQYDCKGKHRWGPWEQHSSENVAYGILLPKEGVKFVRSFQVRYCQVCRFAQKEDIDV